MGAVALGEEHGRQRIDLIVQANCLTKPLHFKDCDVNGLADKCKTMEPAEFRRSCSEIQIVREH